MLVATPGQTAKYSLHGTATKNPCHTIASVNTVKNTNQLTHQTQNTTRHNCSKLETTSTASSLMKTLSVRLNRSTEFLKSTVQKALISTSGVSLVKTNAAITVSAPIGKTAAAPQATYLTAAKRLANASLIKRYIVPPTVTHRFPDRQLTSSTDSLHKEMCHFKPIRSAPTTPWKCGSKSRGVYLKVPKAGLAMKNKFNFDCDVTEEDDNDESDGEIEDNSTIKDENVNFKPKPSSFLTATVSSEAHQSAFVCLVTTQMKNLLQKQSKLWNKSVDLNKTKSTRRTIRNTSKLKEKTASKLASLRSRCSPKLKVKKEISRQPNSKGKRNVLLAEPPKDSLSKGAKSKPALSKTKRNKNNPTSLTAQQKNIINNNNNNNISEDVTKPQRKASKRKIKPDLNEANGSNNSSAPIHKQLKRSAVDCYTPPLTRSRLRQTQGKLDVPLGYRHQLK